ncbi:uncharacterized protein LOC110023986 [Phalaenopsis equestris]|uniref:uncharacterized protein LOC110023986 n=1 Tax=Phalaenopsis equestris TaxID=78828 RepID=UPI0009E1DC5F|nr:uncharacterized protein LOC110023986 [Phalaenopsis equestris]
MKFQLRMFLKGKELWGHIDGSSPAHTEAKDFGQWVAKDAQIVSWFIISLILGSIEAHMVNNLRFFGTTKEMWEYLKRVYNQDNTAKHFQFELDMSNYIQGNLSIEQYYSGFLNLWSEYTGIIYAKVSKENLASFQAIHKESHHDQFLMKLGPEFETSRVGLLNRDPVPCLDICFGKLSRKEQRLVTQAAISTTCGSSKTINMTYAA